MVEGDPLGFLKISLLQNITRIFFKVVIVPKNSKGDPTVSSGFISYVKNGVTERGDPFALT